MTKRSRFAAALAVAAVVLAATLAGADGEILLGYSFEEGYSQDYEVKVNYEVDFGGFAFATIVDMEVTEKCVGVEEDLFVMEIMFNKVEAARMQFDDMEEDPTGEHLTGQSITYMVDAHGVVTEMKPGGYIEGWDQISRMIESVVENWYGYLPNESLAKGAEWMHEETPDSNETVKVVGQSDFVFKEVKKEDGTECARIVGKSASTVSGKQETGMGPHIIEGESKGDIEFLFCFKSSTIIKFKAKSETKMDMTPEAGGNATETTVNSIMERKLLS